MTHRSTSAGGRSPLSTSAHPAARPARGLRRFGAAALAAGTFIGLGALVGPVGVANATPDPAVQRVIDAFAAGGTLTLDGSVTIGRGLTLDGETLTIDLHGHALTITGQPGAVGTAGTAGVDGADDGNGGSGGAGGVGEDGEAGIQILNDASLYVVDTVGDGSLVVTGGAGGIGGAGGNGGVGVDGVAPGFRAGSRAFVTEYPDLTEPGDGGAGGVGGDGGNGGKGIVNNGTIMFVDIAPTVAGGVPGSGGNGGYGGNGGASYSGQGDGGVGGAGGAGASGVGVGADGQTGAAGSSESNGGHGGAGGNAGASSGSAWAGDHTQPITFDSAGATEFTRAVVYTASVGDAVTALETLYAETPTKSNYTFGGWFDGDEYEYTNDDLETPASGQEVTAKWTSTGSGGSGTGNGGGSGAPATVTPTTTTPATTSKAPATTSAKPTAPTSSTSIPTNNVADPVTFTSTSAPAPQPLPDVSEVNDTSASQFDVDTHTPTQGGNLVLTARGFKPGTVVDFWMHSTPVYLGSAIADIHGVAVLPVLLTPELVGDHHVQSIGTGLLGEPRNLAQPITIAPSGLASTGTPSATLTFLALLLLAGGAALLLADRRRTTAAAHHGATGRDAGGRH